MANTRLEEYVSPFSARYASPEMSHLFSYHYRTILFRRLWISLAKAEKKLGLPISQKQIHDLSKHLHTVHFEQIQKYEKEFRHDVVAHIHAFGDLAPSARPILHLGATSCFVTDNADLIQMKEALKLIFHKTILLLKKLSSFAQKYKNAPCLSYTHYQSAQPTTIGKRATLWLQDFYLDATGFERLLEEIPFLGAKGATGTQSSFLSLFQGSSQKVKKLEELLREDFGFGKTLPISGQTYPRKIDLLLLNALESFAASAHKFANDVRLLAHDQEMLESFDKNQVGSSAMPHKRNPIYSERICGLARFVISLSQNPAYTAATQWLERTLDDSSNRRLAISEAFLGADSILNLLHHLISSLKANPKIALKRILRELPKLSLENILMASVKKGGDRQELHEKLKKIAFASEEKKDPLEFLLKSVEKDKAFCLSRKEVKPLYSLPSLIGRAPEQVSEFLKEEIAPFLAKHKKKGVSISKISF